MDERTAEAVVSSTPEFSATERIERLDDGFSTHEKFLLIEGDAPRYILRFSDIGQLDRRQGEFEVLRRLAGQGVSSSPVPVCFGITDDGSACYTGTGYFRGEDAEAVLPRLSVQEQLDLGRAAGAELRKFHRLTPDREVAEWRAKHLRFYDLGVKAAAAAGVSVPDEQLVASYVQDHNEIVARASIGLMHNDLVPKNVIVDGRTLAGIIDFEWWDWGDPIHDFHKLAWFTPQVSVPFARGQIQGYCSSWEIPAGFWQRYNLHVAMSLHRMLAYIAKANPAYLPDWLARARSIVETHDLRDGGPPTWFK